MLYSDMRGIGLIFRRPRLARCEKTAALTSHVFPPAVLVAIARNACPLHAYPENLCRGVEYRVPANDQRPQRSFLAPAILQRACAARNTHESAQKRIESTTSHDGKRVKPEPGALAGQYVGRAWSSTVNRLAGVCPGRAEGGFGVELRHAHSPCLLINLREIHPALLLALPQLSRAPQRRVRSVKGVSDSRLIAASPWHGFSPGRSRLISSCFSTADPV